MSFDDPRLIEFAFGVLDELALRALGREPDRDPARRKELHTLRSVLARLDQ